MYPVPRVLFSLILIIFSAWIDHGICIVSGKPVLREATEIRPGFKHEIWGITSDGRYIYVDKANSSDSRILSHAKRHRAFRNTHRTSQVMFYTIISDVHWRNLVTEEAEKTLLSSEELLQMQHRFHTDHHSFMGLSNNILLVTFPSPTIAKKFLDYLGDHDSVFMADYRAANTLHKFNAAKWMVAGPNEPMELAKYLDAPHQLISVMDTGLDYTHDCFRMNGTKPFHGMISNGRAWTAPIPYLGQGIVKAYFSLAFHEADRTIHTDFVDAKEGHGTHVSGIAAGKCASANVWENTSGELLFFDVQDNVNSMEDDSLLDIPPSIWHILSTAYTAGSRIFTNSWGSLGCAYTAAAYELDLFVAQHPDMVIIFSAGNMGPENCTITSPAMAKNIISVGSHLNFDSSLPLSSPYHISAFSSRGPTADGRIKPDVLVAGDYILSANARGKEHSDMLKMHGTSQAAPSVALAIAAIQHLIPGSSTALKKAVLLSSTKDFPYPLYSAIQKAGPRLETLFHEPIEGQRQRNGFGYVQLHLFDSIAYKDMIEIKENTPVEWCFRYDSHKRNQIPITMVYTDLPSIPLPDTSLLVNNIDLQVHWNNRSYNGNDAEGDGDTLNNVEMVRLPFQQNDLVLVQLLPRGKLRFLNPAQFVQYVALAFPKAFQMMAKETCTIAEEKAQRRLSRVPPPLTEGKRPPMLGLYLGLGLGITVLFFTGAVFYSTLKKKYAT